MRAVRAISIVLSALLVTLVVQVVAESPSSASTFTETVGGNANTWTNYTNAGGTQGPTIPGFTSVQITCALPGFRVADGNTWWYQIASSPWNNLYYVSADAFYNNGQTSGSLHGTPFVDPAVPTCASIAGGVSETAGGAANTWTNYTNAGGSQGPTIGGGATVQIACALTGFRVADGNTWWYQIASSPWSHAYYVSADAFYNNGQTSGSLRGTPFVDPAVPLCSSVVIGTPGTGVTEQQGHNGVNTFANYHNASALGPRVDAASSVQVSCKVYDPTIASVNPDGYWYRIANSPWNNQYYAPANTFMNGDPWGGPYTHNTDFSVPDCTDAPRSGTPSVSLGQGPAAPAGFRYAVSLSGFPAGTSVSLNCYDSVSPGGFYRFTLTTDGSGSAFTQSQCYSGDGPDHWVVASGAYTSNHLSWGSGGSGGTRGIKSAAAGVQGSTPPRSQNSTTCQATRHPVNCATGDFWHTFQDFSIPDRGLPLAFSHTYTSSAASTGGRLGMGWTDSYNMSLTTAGSNVSVTEENGAIVTFVSDGAGGFTAPPYVLATLISNSDGTFTFTRLQSQVRYVFSAFGELQRVVDRNGYATTLGYTDHQMTSITSASGRTLTLGYTGSQITRVTDPLGRFETFVYDEAGNLSSQTYPAGGVESFTYDANHLVLTMTDPRGGIVTNVYNSAGRVTSQTDPAGLTTSWTFSGDNASAAGGYTSMTDPNGQVTKYSYQNLELQSVTHALGTPLEATTSYAYDPATLGITSITDPLGHITTYSYDSRGNLLSKTDPLGHTTSQTYNTFNEPLTSTDALGAVTTSTYDASGNPLTTTGPTGDTTTFVYGDATHPGDVTSQTDGDGRTTSFTYAGGGEVASKTVSRSAGSTDVARFTYDADGEQICKVSPNAVALGIDCPAPGAPSVPHTTETTYDAKGRVASISDPNAHVTTYQYDGNGNRTRVTDPSGHSTNSAFDLDGRHTSTTDANGAVTSTAFDGNGNTTSVTDPNGKITSSTFDALNRVTSTTNPLGEVTTYGYDLAGNRTSLTDPKGRVTNTTFDTANEITTISYSDGITHGVSYSYDAAGRRKTMTDGTGVTFYGYDQLGRLTSSTDGALHTIAHSYDAAGHPTVITYPNGHTVTETYDGAGNPLSIKDWLGHTTTFSYDGDGNVTSQTTGSSPAVTDTYSYDFADQLVSISDSDGSTVLQHFNYTRTASDLVASATPDASPPINYNYDPTDRLNTDAQGSYAYDPAGNPTTFRGVPQTFNSGDQLVASGTGNTALAYTYDHLGNRTARVAATGKVAGYSYDQANRLTAIVGRTIQPAITSISPASGPVAGGTTVTITGTGFSGATAVQFGGHPAPFTVVSSHTITTTAPAGLSAVNITVTRAAGTSPLTTNDRFTYTGGPAVGSLTPSKMGSTANPTITITGVGFTGATKVYFGLKASAHVTVVSDTKITATAPTGSASVHVRIVNGTATSPIVAEDRFAYAQTSPTITHISPNSGPATGNTNVVVLGTGFSSATAVRFGTTAALKFNVRSDGALTATAPPGSSTTDVTVTNQIGTSPKTAADRYSYLSGAVPVATYEYNGDGLRTSKTVGATTSSFAWDTNGELPMLLSNTATSFIYGPGGLPLESISSTGTVEFFHHDQIGSTTLLTSASGTTDATFTYTSFGQLKAHTGTVATALGFTGQYQDSESGLYYLRARYYDPVSGQFLTVDPAIEQTRVPYGYAGSDPLNFVDPSGNFSVGKLIWTGVGLALGIGAVVVAAPTLTAAGAAVIGLAFVAAGVGGAIAFDEAFRSCQRNGFASSSCGSHALAADLGTLVSVLPGLGSKGLQIAEELAKAGFGYLISPSWFGGNSLSTGSTNQRPC